MIDLEASVDEWHRRALAELPADLFDLSDIPLVRDRIRRALEAVSSEGLIPDEVDIEEVFAPGVGGQPRARLKVYRPRSAGENAAVLYWIHGGGMVLRSADDDDLQCATRAMAHQCIVVSVDYRLAPESPAPAQIDDCFAGLRWLADNTVQLGVDSSRVMIGGASAGGGLAAGTALRARDEGGPRLTAQFLLAPMLDYRNETQSSHAIADRRVWNREANTIAWSAYLGTTAPTIYSAPSLALDLSGLPETFINVGALDMFLDENVVYAQLLIRSNVPTDLHVYAGAFHGSSRLAPQSPVSMRWRADEESFLARMLSPRD